MSCRIVIFRLMSQRLRIYVMHKVLDVVLIHALISLLVTWFGRVKENL